MATFKYLLDFLKAVVCEALRLYPSVPFDSKARLQQTRSEQFQLWSSKVAINDDILPDGTFVPGGTVASWSQKDNLEIEDRPYV